MDAGHYNCRDYAFSAHFAVPTHINDHRLRHESFDELEARSRSPASMKPKFPLLQLPWELRQQILQYLLPHTLEAQEAGLSEHGRRVVSNGVKKRETSLKGPTTSKSRSSITKSGPPPANNIVWRRGNIKIFGVCRQLHDECAQLMYGANTFLLFVTYAEVKFRYRWLLPSGVAPIREFQFLECMPERYMRLVRRLVVNVEHVDGYTGMVKFNVSGKGLAVGLRNRVQSLVNALRAGEPFTVSGTTGLLGDSEAPIRHMSRVNIRVSNGNAAIDALKSDAIRRREGDSRVNGDIETILEPFGQLRNVGSVNVTGAVSGHLVRSLEEKMKSTLPVEEGPAKITFLDDAPGTMRRHGVQLCVYGNDI